VITYRLDINQPQTVMNSDIQVEYSLDNLA
jgi:hypothetical protein